MREGTDRSRYEEEEEEDGSSTDKCYQSESDIDEDAVTDWWIFRWGGC